MEKYKCPFKFLLFLTLLCALPVIIYGAPPDQPLTGNTVEYCDITFVITDNSGGSAENIKLLFTDIAMGKTYDFHLEKDSDFSKDKYYRILANSTYIITYEIAEGYELVNSDKTPVEKTHATASGLILDWTIQEKTADSSVSAPSDAEPVSADIAEGQALFDAFREKFSDEKYERFLKSETVAIHRVYFAERGYGTEDEWKEFSNLDKACWWDFYLQFTYYLEHSGRAKFDDEQQFYSTFLRAAKSSINNLQLGDDAYETLADITYWQYNYFMTNHTFYNFMTGETYSAMASLTGKAKTEEKPAEPAKETPTPEPSPAQEDSKYTATEKPASEPIASKSPASESQPSAPETSSKLSNVISRNKISIAIAVILLIVSGGFILYRKKQNNN